MTKQSTILINEDLIEDGQPIVLALSGGPDSVCLLLELMALSAFRIESGGPGNKIVCAHVNHGLRGAESDGDEEYVVSLCERLGLPVFIKKIDAAALAKNEGKTTEEIGREIRYAFFDEICDEICDEISGEPDAVGENPVIAVAHNQDDQIETILMRILRGTGTDGLTGISPSRISALGYRIVRPLLEVSRKEIEERLSVYGETVRTDNSNSNPEYFRNKIRIEILPLLEDKLGENIKKSLLRLSKNAAEDRDYFGIIVSEALDEFLEYHEHGDAVFCSMPADVLASVHPAIRRRLIRAVFAELGLKTDIGAVHLDSADKLLITWQDGGEASGKRVEFPGDFTFGIEKKKAVFRTPESACADWKPRRKL